MRQVINQGQKMYRDSGHDLAVVATRTERQPGLGNPNLKPGADFQAIISCILDSMRSSFTHGMRWDFPFNGKLYKNLLMHFFVDHVRCDNVEGDKLCGKFGVRTGNVKSICRKCLTPTELTSCCVNKLKPKSAEQIKRLIAGGKVEQLTLMSQQSYPLAYHDGIQFGFHNKLGIHANTPADMMHTIELGWFKYDMSSFIAMLGEKSQAMTELETFSVQVGTLMGRQSDRSMPRTKFSKGINSGKLTARERTGAVLLLVVCLSSAHGKRILQRQRGGKFRDANLVADWISMLTDHLTFHEWMSLHEFDVSDVRKMEHKLPELMYRTKQTWNRQTGMGAKFSKFHLVRHFHEDMLNHGAPSVYDTPDNESHFKQDKSLCTMTQKDITKVEAQTTKRDREMEMMTRAMDELEGGRKQWDYFDLDEHPPIKNSGQSHVDNVAVACGNDQPPVVTVNGGTKIHTMYSDAHHMLIARFLNSRGPSCFGVDWDPHVIRYLQDLKERRLPFLQGQLDIFTEHKRDEQIFRGHPNFRGSGLWNDWALWYITGYAEPIPCCIWCFVDLTGIPSGVELVIDGMKIDRGIYAVVEAAPWDMSQEDDFQDATTSELVRRCTKLGIQWHEQYAHRLEGRKFILADVEAIYAAACVIPDIGHDNRAKYLWIRSREDWPELFQNWLRSPVDQELLDDERAALSRYWEDTSRGFDDYYEEGEDSSDGED